MVYGDWSVGKQMRNFISTPNKGIKKKMSTRFKTYSIDEFRSSLINYKTLEKTENLYLRDRQGTLRKKHSILTYKTESGRQGCINRDKSAVNGMRIITKYFIEHRERHPAYKRESKKAIDLEAHKKEPNKKDKLTEKEKIPRKKKLISVKRIDESERIIYIQSC